ncbi:hypothetical protein BKH41_03855 [Helicobacter sp. 12S02232-10]|nr:hypothetical protein BKH41_03855 [Helicobacter sp. 12S02232-10]
MQIQKTKIQDNETLGVNARELWKALEVGKDFSTWIKDRISKYGFVANEDFIIINSLTNFGEQANKGNAGGQNRIDYILTLDTAKQIAMVENNQIGMEVRRYFITCEKSLHSKKVPTNYIEALELALLQAKEIQSLENQIQNDKPLVSFANSVANASNAIPIGDFAKLLFDENIKIGQNRLFKWLRENKYILPNNQPYQEMLERGYLKVIEQTYKTPYGDRVSTKTLITGKGQIFLTEKLKESLFDEVVI